MTDPIKNLGPLDWRMAIVDKGGRPTPEFQRRWNTQRDNNSAFSVISLGEGEPAGDPVEGNGYIDTTTDPYSFYIAYENDWHKVGPSEFTDLLDAPSSYTGEADSLVQVNPTEDGLIFTPLDGLTANPTAVAGDVAVNGTADTFMRSDASPAVQKASSSQFGIVKVDGTTITESGGVISSAGGGGATSGWTWSGFGVDDFTLVTVTVVGGVTGTPQDSMGPTPIGTWKWIFNAPTPTVTFDFGQSVVISGIGFYQSSAFGQGSWQVAGSHDNSTYTNLGSPGAWGPAVKTIISFTNTTAYRYYKLTQTSGFTQNNPTQNWFVFKWG